MQNHAKAYFSKITSLKDFRHQFLPKATTECDPWNWCFLKKTRDNLGERVAIQYPKYNSLIYIYIYIYIYI